MKKHPEAQTSSTPQSSETKIDATSQTTPKPQNETEHLTGYELYALVFALMLAMLILTLDITIVSTAIPKITDQFHTIADIGWYPAAYLISNSALQPVAGKLYRHFPLKYSFLSFVAVFELGSLLCGVAVSSKMLIVGRAVAGCGGAGLMSGSFSIVGFAAPPHQRAMYLGLLMSLAGAGQLIGPLIGGSLAEHVTWRWCFYLNLPVGAVTVLFMFFIRFPENKHRIQIDWTLKRFIQEFDILGFFIFAPSCIMMLLALQWGGVDYPWNSATVIGLICGSVVIFVIFGFWEWKQGDRAMIPGSILGNRVVYSSSITAAFLGGSMLTLAYYLPLWFQVIKKASPTMSGVYTLATFVSQVITSVVAGILVRRIRYLVLFAMVGSALSAIGSGLMSTFTITTGAGAWIGYQIIVGTGRGLSIQVPFQAVQEAVQPRDIPTATSIASFANLFGGALIVALARTAFANLLVSGLHNYAPSVNAGAVIDAGATNYPEVLGGTDKDMLVRQVEIAYNWAITRTYFLGTGVACAAVICAIGIGRTKAPKKKKTQKVEKSNDKDTPQASVSTVESKAPKQDV